MDINEMYAYLYESKIIDSNLNIIEDDTDNNEEDIDLEEEPEEEISIYKVLKLNKK